VDALTDSSNQLKSQQSNPANQWVTANAAIFKKSAVKGKGRTKKALPLRTEARLIHHGGRVLCWTDDWAADGDQYSLEQSGSGRNRVAFRYVLGGSQTGTSVIRGKGMARGTGIEIGKNAKNVKNRA